MEKQHPTVDAAHRLPQAEPFPTTETGQVADLRHIPPITRVVGEVILWPAGKVVTELDVARLVAADLAGGPGGSHISSYSN
ncbi:hypothetical protein [Micromonospora sp. NPDC000442]|uniref:hypothetical protein n=1 Tax=Micromonospora sp. NPDC000442 TaxID=3364217 RepID=UPI0036BF528D